MDRKSKKQTNQGQDNRQKEGNAGSGAFNQGSQQDPDYDKGTKVSDEEKETGHLPLPDEKDDQDKDK